MHHIFKDEESLYSITVFKMIIMNEEKVQPVLAGHIDG